MFSNIYGSLRSPLFVSLRLDKDKQAKYPGAVVGRLVANSPQALDDAVAALPSASPMMHPQSRPVTKESEHSPWNFANCSRASAAACGFW